MLIGKRVVDFLSVVMKFFSLGVTAEALRANIDWKSALFFERDQFDPKFQVQGVVPQQLFLGIGKNKRFYVQCKNVGTSFFRFVAIHAFVRRTDGRIDIFFARANKTALQHGKKTILWQFVNMVGKQWSFDDVVIKTLLK